MDAAGSDQHTPDSVSGSLNSEAALDRSGPSIRKSCEACRTSKAKCQPSPDDMRKCHRCFKDGRDCIFAEAKPRLKKAKTSRTRVAEMEQKLDGIFALLQSGKMESLNNAAMAPIPIEAPPSPKITIPTMNSPLQPQWPTDNGSRYTFGSSSLGQSMMPVSKASGAKYNDVQDSITKGIVSLEAANQLLELYRPYPSNFPFVPIAPHMSLEDLRRNRPFSLLAILCISSIHDLKLQAGLEYEFRENLSRKVIMNGEKGMDILQGLLLYLTWYHYFFDPENEQIYQLSQLAIAMAVDLGITRPARKNRLHNAWKCDGVVGDEYVQQKYPVPARDLEARRTFVGCYYLSSSLSTAFRKPSSLDYTDYVGECCQILADTNEMPADKIITHFCQLQRLKEDVNNTFDYDDYQSLPPMDASRIEMLIKTFNRQMATFQDTFPPEVWSNTAITLTFFNLRIYIHEIGLHATKPSKLPVESMPSAQSCRDWFSSVARTDALITCLDATKDYLDRYLSLSIEQVRTNTLIEEVKIVYALLVLGKYVSGVDSPNLDLLALRESSNIMYYLDALIARMDCLITTVDSVEQRNYFYYFRCLFLNSKKWYEAQISGDVRTMVEFEVMPFCLAVDLQENVPLNPEQETTPSDTSSTWGNGPGKVWSQETPLAVPAPTKALGPGIPATGEAWNPTNGFFDNYPMALDPRMLNFDYTGMADEELNDFMNGL